MAKRGLNKDEYTLTEIGRALGISYESARKAYISGMRKIEIALRERDITLDDFYEIGN